MELPKISILIPTLNSSGVLEGCLKSISAQDYPKELVEIVVADGGSADRTVEIARKYGASVVENKLKTAEAGKAVGLKNSSGEYVALVDSDNILPDNMWLKQMVTPLVDNPEYLGSEPLEYTWRKQDGFISRYCALIGMNDPLVMFLGNYDRMNLITRKWTEVSHDEQDLGNYLLVKFKGNVLPTIGANGTLFRSSFLKEFSNEDYLFDIDVLFRELKKSGEVKFIKVKNGIIHTFCESDLGKFIRKQKRRIRDYLFFKNTKGIRSYDWDSVASGGIRSAGILKFTVYCLTLFPLIAQSVVGYSRKRDYAWFFHPLACEITFFVYGWHRVFSAFYKTELKRDRWKQ